jgi:hypothetical protein
MTIGPTYKCDGRGIWQKTMETYNGTEEWRRRSCFKFKEREEGSGKWMIIGWTRDGKEIPG